METLVAAVILSAIVLVLGWLFDIDIIRAVIKVTMFITVVCLPVLVVSATIVFHRLAF